MSVPDSSGPGSRAGPAPSAGERLRGLIAVYASTYGVSLVFGYQPPLVAFRLERAGASAFDIGAVTAATTLAVMLCGPLYPRLIARLGLRRACALGTLGCSLVLLAMTQLEGTWNWLVLRALTGCALGLEWIASEIWLNQLSTDASRGRVMATYTTVFAAGVVSGPLLLAWTGTRGALPFLVGSACMVATLLPLGFVGTLGVDVPGADARTSLRRLVGIAPLVMAAGFIAGLMESADISLLPVYGLQRGLTDSAALYLVSAFLAGNVLLQLPIAWLADRMGRRRALALCAVASALGPPLLGVVMHVDALRWPLLVLWGGTMYGFYTQGIALLGESYFPAELAAANTLFVVVYCSGGIVGPLLGGLAMDQLRPDGLLWFLALAAAALLPVLALCGPARPGSRHRNG